MALSFILTLLRNASLAKVATILIPQSKFSIKIISALVKHSYLKGFTKEKNKQYISVFLEYFGWWYKKPGFSTLVIVSTPGKSQYCGFSGLRHKVSNIKSGTLFLSTPVGVLGHSEALDLKIGGNILCYVDF